ncbi:MAG TPA: glycosyl hydrolase [Bacteroidales bacterium]|nr:glycosyl hydrolase [Bacteroidales bacterium]
MKKLLLILATFAAMVSCKQTGTTKTTGHYSSFSDIKGLFADPPAEFRTVPFWVWNEAVTREMIDEQLLDFKSKGFGGVFVHPRYGLLTGYMTDEWYSLVKYATEKAKVLGMNLWLYDENSFPSGFAGGHVPAEMPESYNKGVALQLHGMNVLDLDTTKVYPHVYKIEDGKAKDITTEVKSYLGKSGDFKVLELTFYPKSKWYAGYSYVDLLYKGVTEKFIDVTMKGYEKTIGNEFGTVVPGIFTDEPNINPPGRRAIRWTPDLYSTFKQTWGYDLGANLLSLFEETGDWQKIRHDYYAVLLNMFVDRWAKPWHDYTEKENLKWTGHYWEHGWPNPVHGGDNMAMYPYHQVPAIDMLFNTVTERPDQFGNVRAVKELASVANQFERNRALSETYGASGYELDFTSMKRNGDWEYALGVNLMNQHLSYQSMLGDRKHDFPQTFSYHAPWWNDYRVEADYFGRLSLVLSSGKQINNTVIIEPTTTAWMFFQPASDNKKLMRVEKQFRGLIDGLERHKIEYDLASEKTMKDFGKAADGLLTVSSKSYDLVVLPGSLLNVESSTADLLKDFLSSGGNILALGVPPTFVDGVVSDRMKNLKNKYSKSWFEAKSLDDQAVLQMLDNGVIHIDDAEAKADSVYYMRRTLDDGQAIFFANYQRGAVKDFIVSMSGFKDIVEMDARDGKYYNVSFTKKGKTISFPVHLDDAGSKLYFASPGKIKVERDDRDNWTPSKEIETQKSEVQRMSPNVVSLDYCYLDFPDVKNDGDTLYYFYVAHDKIFRHYGFRDNPWVSSSQFKTYILDRDTFGINTGFTATFPISVEENTNVSDINVVVERPELYTVMVNGHKLEQEDTEWYLDKGTGVFPAGAYMKEGENLIDVIASPFSVKMELAPVFLIGNFGVVPARRGWKITSEMPVVYGSWKDMGMPFYPNKVEYTKMADLKSGVKTRVVLAKWNGSCASVSVNGQLADVLAWPPFESDITPYLKDGENRVTVTVTGSLKNLIGPFHFVKTKGIATPWSFKYAPGQQPSGSDYDMVDYGLFESFKIMTE